MDPLISPGQCQRVHGYTSQAQSQGATLVTGGHPLTEDKPAGSSFYEPTLFTDVTPDMTIFQEEVFGPVGVIVPFTSEDEAVTLAHQSTYGLAAAVYANDLGTAHRVAQRVEAGMVWINEFNAHAMEMPFGGYKQSGIGKDYSMHALDS